MSQPTSRRDVLKAGLGLALPFHFAGVASAAPGTVGAQRAVTRDGAGKRLLVLGGTRFLGPAIVDEALARGFDVSLFNRGRSNPDWYAELDKRVGDRDTGDLASLAEGEWDLVVDTSCYLPGHARQAAELLAGRVGQYVLISTISVYDEGDRDPQTRVVDEGTAVGAIAPEDEARVTSIREVMLEGGRFYGPLKARCEDELEAVFGARATSLRPGVIAGPLDPSDRFTYWVVRVGAGGEVLCPAERDQAFQATDVRDLARWSLDFGLAGTGGRFNAVGYGGTVTLEEFLHGCKVVLGADDARFTWCSEEFLLEHEVRPFQELPFWLPREVRSVYGNAKGRAAGMTFRPIGETILEVAAWHASERPADFTWQAYGMQPEREAALLAAWAAR